MDNDLDFSVDLDDSPDIDEAVDNGFASEYELRLNTNKTFQIVSDLNKIQIPKENEELILVTNRKFNAVHFTKMICEKELVEEAVFWFFSVNVDAAKIIINLIDTGRIANATVIISNIRNNSIKANDLIVKEMFEECEAIRLIYANSHIKTVALKAEKGYYCLNGTGNFNHNSRREQYEIYNSKEMYLFTLEWMKEFSKDKDWEEI